jgi:hypothetical protein
VPRQEFPFPRDTSTAQRVDDDHATIPKSYESIKWIAGLPTLTGTEIADAEKLETLLCEEIEP